MATDYDEPRRNESDPVVEDSLEVLKERHREAQSPVVDVEEPDTAEGFELPGADLSGEELSVRVVPKQADEFTCFGLLPRPPPTPLRRRPRGPADLPRLRCLTWRATARDPVSPACFPSR